MSASGSIAVIGLAGRFPGAANVAEFWRNLEHGVESITFFSDQDLRRAGVDAALAGRADYVKAKGILEEVELFDASFFGFSPREAELTDPQHRLFLECAVQALDDAGCDPARYQGLAGVYAGAGINSYLLALAALHRDPANAVEGFQISIHNKADHLTTRTAYKLNLRGPAVTVQTACSTSLVAIAMACQSLVDFQCDLALAGGVTVHVPQRCGYVYQPGGIASPDGHCRAFDARAQGTVDGSGVGVVVLKRLEDALAGDRILAVIRGWALNNDGGHKQGYTAPGLDSQADVIAAAQAMAGVTADTIQYVEAHGTGTALGDPIEIAALERAFRLSTDRTAFCAVGSVKSNIGHLDAAAGVAGVIKTVLALERGRIPPTLHFEAPNPQIDFARSPFYVNARLTEWPRGASPRRAGVSAFGLGGTNAHVVLEEAPDLPAEPSGQRCHLLVLSAKTSSALETATEDLARHLELNPDKSIADVAFTLQVGRAEWKYRRAVVTASTAEAVPALRELSPSCVFSRAQEPVHRPVFFLFPGQGAQYLNMAADVYRRQPVFRQHVDECAALLAPHLGLDLREILYPRDDRDRQSAELLAGTMYAQPALFAVEYALARLWMHWGVRPDAMIGHSVGEYVAACLAGVASLPDALMLLAARSRLVMSLPRGAMLATPVPERDLLPLLHDDLSLAAVNGPSQCTVSGSEEAITSLHAELTRRGSVCRRLPVSHAFHSRMMDPIVDAFADAAARVEWSAPKRPYLSNVTGGWVTSAPDAAYWARHLRETVRFDRGIRELLKRPEALFLEVGPGRTLKTVTRWHPAKMPEHIVEQSLPHADDATPADSFLLAAAGKLWLAGLGIDWHALHAPARPRRVSLPSYPFERRRHWIDASGDRAATGLRRKPDVADWFYSPVWSETVPAPLDSSPARRGPWLLFVDSEGVGGELRGLLEQARADVVTVAEGEDFARLGERQYRIDPARPEHYTALLEHLGRPFESIVHLWSVGGGSAPAERVLDRSFYSLLSTAQALGRHDFATPLDIVVASDGIHRVIGDEPLCPEKATLLGPCRVIPREDERIACRSVDFARRPGWSPALWARELLGELLRPGPERTVAFRDGRRWVQRYQPVRFETASGLPARVRQGGVYLISGGFGGVGLEIAAILARRAQAKLVLFSRVPRPERTRMLRDWGAEVMVAAADVTDAAQVGDVVRDAVQRFGAIHGVVHAAGIPGGGLIQLRSAEAASRVLRPKIAGARVLDSACRDQPLDFFVLCGSLGAVVGRAGQVDYCAANAFLDCFAQERSGPASPFWVSVAWGEWRNVGMAAAARRVFRPGKEEDEEERRDAAGHPSFDARAVRASGEEVLTTRFNVRRHWMLDEHRIHGHPVIPGVGFIEMVRAALADRAAGRTLELQDVLFIAPLLVRDNESREVRLVLARDGEAFRFSIESDAAGQDGSDIRPIRYAAGRVTFAAPEPKTCDIADLLTRLSLHEEVAPDAVREEDLGPRWQNVRRAWVGGNEVLTHLELAPEFSTDLEHVGYHPALMDRAAGRAQEYLVEGIYLPVGYQRLRIHAAVPNKIFSYARRRPSEAAAPETLTFDTLVADESGRVLVEMDGFTQKRLNDAVAAIRFMASEAPVVERSDRRGDPDAGMRPEEAVDAFARILAYGSRPQIAVSPSDLDAELESAGAAVRARVREETTPPAETRARSAPRRAANAFVASRTETERVIAQAWQDVLGIDAVGVDDNFFALGGDSVQAIQIIARLADAGVRLTPQQFFQHQTVAELAGAIGDRPLEGIEPAASPAASPAPSPGFPLSRLDATELETLAALIDETDAATPAPARPVEPMQFSLFYFADDQEEPRQDKYRLYLEGARFADRHGLTAVWTPERHFHAKGGLYPNPSVLCAALATLTTRVQLRAGSVVLPLHHPLRVAEEWSVVDNLSNGRVGISFTSGWLPNDFAFFPERYATKREELLRALADVRALWRGESMPARDGAGQPIAVRVFPAPLQRTLPVWLTCSGDPEMFVKAGELGVHVLTALLTQTFDQAAERIALYREARSRSGHDPAAGCVTMMLHTFVGTDQDRVLRTVRDPLVKYLKSHAGLISTGAESLNVANPDQLRGRIDDLAAFAFERYYRTASLIGTPESCVTMVEKLRGIGVDEIACLIDFGIGVDDVLASLPYLVQLKELSAVRPARTWADA